MLLVVSRRCRRRQVDPLAGREVVKQLKQPQGGGHVGVIGAYQVGQRIDRRGSRERVNVPVDDRRIKADVDVERWLDLVGERKALRREIGKIAEDYDERVWKARQEERDERQKDVTRDDGEDGERKDSDVVEGLAPVPDSEEPEGERKGRRAEGSSIDEPLMDPLDRPRDGDDTKAKT